MFALKWRFVGSQLPNSNCWEPRELILTFGLNMNKVMVNLTYYELKWLTGTKFWDFKQLEHIKKAWSKHPLKSDF